MVGAVSNSAQMESDNQEDRVVRELDVYLTGAEDM
jgi:hypothetical protein